MTPVRGRSRTGDRGIPRAGWGGAVRLLALAVLLAVCVPGLAAAQFEPIEPPPHEPLHDSLTSFGAESGLEDKVTFTVDFEADGTAWFASSDGLYRYDGYRWTRFGVEDGLPGDYIRCAMVTSAGRLWVGTDRGAGTFDGEVYDDSLTRGRLAGPSVRRIVEDADGTLWFCCDRWPDPSVTAGLSRLRAGEWTNFGVESGLPSDYVSDVFRDRRGELYVLTRSGLARLDEERFVLPLAEAGLPDCDTYIWSMVDSPVHGLMVATRSDLFVRKGEAWSRFELEYPILAPKLALLSGGEVVACSIVGDRARFHRWTGQAFAPVDHEGAVAGANVQHTAIAPDRSVWAVGSAVLRWQVAGHRWVSFPGLPPPRGGDADGAVWFADPERVVRRDAAGWARIPGGRAPLLVASSGAVWMRVGDRVGSWRSGSLTTYDPAPLVLGAGAAFHEDGAGAIWVIGNRDLGGERILRFDGSRRTHVDVPPFADDEVLVKAVGHPSSGLCLLIGDSRTHAVRLLHVDVDEVDTIALPGSYRSDRVGGVFLDRDGSSWIYGFTGAFRRGAAPGASWGEVEFPGTRVLSVVRNDEALWVAYAGDTGGRNGVSRSRDGGWEEVTRELWLFSGRGPDGTLIYRTSEGLVRVGPEDEVREMRLLPRGLHLGSAVVLGNGETWLASGNRVLHYRPDGVPPDTIVVGEPSASHGDALALEVVGVERFRPRRSPAAFRVATRLDGGEWRDHGRLEEVVTLRGLDVGAHEIEVRVEDENGVVDPTPARVLAAVWAVPLQDRLWFRAATLLVFLVVLGLALTTLLGWRRDIRNRRRAEAHQAMIMSELDHRVKNNLATVLALSEQTFMTTDSAEEFNRSFTGRIRALARTHEALADASWQAVEIGELVGLALEAFLRAEPERVTIEGERIRVPSRACSQLCMALHELATNAAKYGALSEPAGRVAIRWRRDDDLTIEWTESGGPPVTAPSHTGLGLTLIQGMIEYELGGRVEIDFAGSGVVCRIEVPLTGETLPTGSRPGTPAA